MLLAGGPPFGDFLAYIIGKLCRYLGGGLLRKFDFQEVGNVPE